MKQSLNRREEGGQAARWREGRARMHVIGLTGGIATGKTTIANRLKQRGATIIEADEVAREIVQPEYPVLLQIASAFGNQYVMESGALNRRRMAELIFSEPEARRKLNALMHPPMVSSINRRLEALRGQRVAPAGVVVVAAVLYEMGLDSVVEAVIAATAERKTRILRLVDKGMTREEAEARIDAQTPQEVLSGKSRWVLSTEGSVSRTFRQVDKIWEEITSPR